MPFVEGMTVPMCLIPVINVFIEGCWSLQAGTGIGAADALPGDN